jgi:hypothetical protein
VPAIDKCLILYLNIENVRHFSDPGFMPIKWNAVNTGIMEWWKNGIMAMKSG